MNETSTGDAAGQLQRQRDGGASWFYWVAALSLINTFSAFTGSDWRFVIGLGVTQFADVFAAEAEGGGRVIALLISLGIAGLFAAFGYFGRRRSALLALGMLLFALDGAVFVLVQDWVGVGFHVFVLFFMWAGFRAGRALEQLPDVAPAHSS